MDNAQKPGKRIVSRGEYAWLRGKTAGIFASGLVLWGIALIGGSLTLVTMIALAAMITAAFFSLDASAGVGAMIGGMSFAIALFAALTYTFGKWACIGMEYDGVKDVVPLDRVHPADLPAAETLVRASQEPAQAQEAILLRAATAGQERHEEHLLRAAAE